MMAIHNQLKRYMRTTETVLKGDPQLLALGEEMEISFADAAMVAEEMACCCPAWTVFEGI
jgi:hypothetical protein